MKNTWNIKRGVAVAVLATASTTVLAGIDFSHRDAFALEMISARPILNTSNTPISRLDTSVAQLVELAGVDSLLDQSQIDLFNNLESSDATVSANFNSAIGKGTVGVGTRAIGATQSSAKMNPVVAVPVPTAAFAGMGMLLSFAGIRYFRTRK